MKRLLLVVGLLGFTSPALAAGPWYAGGQLGLAIFHDVDASQAGGSATVAYSMGFGIGGVAGYRFTENLRLEGEIGYKTADVDTVGGHSTSGSLSTLGFLANGYYDITQANLPVTPFVGLGLGLIHGTFKGGGQSDSDTQFGYQITLGVSYAVNPNLSVLGFYRFQGSSDFSASGTTLPYKASNLMIGANYFF